MSLRRPRALIVDKDSSETAELQAFLTAGGFDVAHVRLDAYVWVLNLFDTRNAFTVYTSTGSPLTTGFLNTNDGRAYVVNADSQGKDGAGQYRLAEGDPTLFGNPRLVRFGLRTSF